MLNVKGFIENIKSLHKKRLMFSFGQFYTKEKSVLFSFIDRLKKCMFCVSVFFSYSVFDRLSLFESDQFKGIFETN